VLSYMRSNIIYGGRHFVINGVVWCMMFIVVMREKKTALRLFLNSPDTSFRGMLYRITTLMQKCGCLVTIV
jgi:hypothetical protein